MLFEHIRGLPGHDVPQDSAADSRDDAEENDEETVFSITGFHTCVDADHRECAQPDGVQDVHDFFVAFHIFAAKEGRTAAKQKEEDEDGEERGKHINGIAEHIGRNIADQKISHHSAPYRSGNAQDDDAEQIQLLSDGNHSA